MQIVQFGEHPGQARDRGSRGAGHVLITGGCHKPKKTNVVCNPTIVPNTDFIRGLPVYQNTAPVRLQSAKQPRPRLRAWSG